MAVVSISYKEFSKKKGLEYKSVQISYADLKKKKVFNSGNFIKDWYDCNKFIINKLANKEYISHSSSVDHFIMDGAPYSSAYLHADDKEVVLKYMPKQLKSKAKNLKEHFEGKEREKWIEYYSENQHILEGVEFFVDKGKYPTWEQLREQCGDKIRANKN